MKILAIDPGTTHSGYVIWDDKVLEFGKIVNKDIIPKIKGTITLIEQQDYVTKGNLNFIRTAEWAGRFFQAASLPFFFGRNEMKSVYGLKKDTDVKKFIKEKYNIKLSYDSWQAFLLIHHYLNI